LKKIITLALALMLAFTFAACGAKEAVQDAVRGAVSGGNSSAAPSASQSSDSATPSSETSEEPESESDDTAGDGTILVKQVSRGFSGNDGEAFLEISFARHPAEGVDLTEFEAVDAAAAGFSTTGDFKLLTASVGTVGTLHIVFEATEENYGDLPDIAYDMPPEPVLTGTDGTPVESFSHPIPYNNFDLFE
jgi:hypothetical protein